MRAELLTLAGELAEVGRLMADDDVAGAMHRVAVRAVRAIPGCDHAVIVTRTEAGVEVVASADDGSPEVLQPGPVIEALTFVEPRRLDDTATDQRWPAFAAQLAGSGYRSCLVLPLPNSTEPAAVLALYSATPDRFADTAYDLELLFALHTGVAFDNVSLYEDSRKLVAQLRDALRTRALIGTAQGLVMHRYTYDTDRAFTALRVASQHNNIKLRDVAAGLVDAHARDELESVLDKLGISAEAG
jgi:GAF domain-containing protein